MPEAPASWAWAWTDPPSQSPEETTPLAPGSSRPRGNKGPVSEPRGLCCFFSHPATYHGPSGTPRVPHGGTLPSSVAWPCSRCSPLVSSVGFRLPLLGSVPESRELPRRVPLSFPRPAHGRRRTHASEGNARARCLSSRTLPGPWPLRATGAARATAQVGSSAKNEWFRQTQTE